MNNIDKLKDLYNKGYKCIRYEDNVQGEFTVYFKNFENEKSETMVSLDKDEVLKIKDFIDNISSLY